MKRRTFRWTYEVIEESDDDEAFEFSDDSALTFLSDLAEDDDDLDGADHSPPQPDPVIGFVRSETKEQL